MDAVWFDLQSVYDKHLGYDYSNSPTIIEDFGFDKPVVIDNIAFVCRAINAKYYTFWLSWGVLIDFSFLKRHKLTFLRGIKHEDHLFGIMLFALCKKIFVLPSKLYIHYIRPASIMTTANEVDINALPQYLLSRYYDYSDTKSLRDYDASSSMFLTAESFISFTETLHDDSLKFLLQKAFLPWFITESFKMLDSKSDTLNLLPRFYILKPYVKDLDIRSLQKCAMYFPSFVHMLKKIRYIERIVRCILRGKITKLV